MIRIITLAGLCAALAGCESVGDNKRVDRGFDSKPLSQLQAGIWIDPNGCDHWIIDDGVEGYLSPRLNRDGTPVCSGNALERNTAIGDFKGGTAFGDVL
ncbi:hypothetical protein GCM10011363_41110 [Marivita lacus]|uniref:Lipoprotein n=1 Tax=Marivita lacus TaxID=1323742 RepID=A0ABQ1LA23_9RHOB|nr:hypothetical protein [Marivita lacus]GGC20239.1 hypothetical protein GCM10011363_41110 [Marivita lacus]